MDKNNFIYSINGIVNDKMCQYAAFLQAHILALACAKICVQSMCLECDQNNMCQKCARSTGHFWHILLAHFWSHPELQCVN